MGPCSGNPHLRWASRLLGLLSLLFSVCRSGTNSDGGPAPGVQDSGAPDPLQGIRGGSVLFPLLKKQDAELEEVTWGFGPGSEYRILLRVRPGEAPTWASLQDRYQQRVHVPNMTSLKIENLTPEDSGLYRARVSFTGGVDFTQVFHLTVYEPVPIPQILVHSPSITQGWCNVTIECRISWGTEDLKVTWEGKGLPRQLEERVTLGPAPNSWNLAVHLPQSQSYTNITCVVSNEVDQKTATFDLGKVCHLGEAHGECTCHRGGALSEFGCSGMKVLGFSPHRVISTTFQGVTPFRSLGSPSRLHLLLSVSQSRLSFPPLAPAGPGSSLPAPLPTLIPHSLWSFGKVIRCVPGGCHLWDLTQ
uniref:Ig-like domain-containing protein n=1 Tax=Sus scrofa TaxID=9823 RepID=A0A8D1CN11_PIG